MHAIVLRYLDQAARAGSIRRTAEHLNVASSAVKRQILRLETEIGVPIFERRGNAVRLTPAGEVLLRHTPAKRSPSGAARDSRPLRRLVHVPLSELALRQARLACLCIGAAPGAHHISVVADELRREFNLLEDDIRPIPSQ
jgi:DNA-binding transcriptional LysR family regulator